MVSTFYRNQLWPHLISYNIFRNVNMYLLEVATCEKWRSSHLQSEKGSKSFEDWVREVGLNILGLGVLPIWKGVTFAGVGQYAITCHNGGT